MNVSDGFSESYRDAREKFLQVAYSKGAQLESHLHPIHRGPLQEALAVDIAHLGDVGCDRVLMIVSGTHGVEGYAGSGCQIHLLLSDLCQKLTAATHLVLVHAINPYGFAYGRRTNEDNVDLNRNFVDFSSPLPENSDYAEHAALFLPAAGAIDDYHQARDRLAREASRRDGYRFLKKALQPGQYEFPNGLYYGGSGPSWSSRVFMQVCWEAFHGATRAAVLDLHTGLGASGVGELIFLNPDLADRYAPRFSAPVSCAGSQASVSAAVKGPLVTAANDHMPASCAISAALEFGTVSLEENVQAMIFEHWTHQYLSPDDPTRQQSVQRFKRAYYCDRLDWKMSVVSRFEDITASLLRCLSA